MPDFYKAVLEPLRRDATLVGAFTGVHLESRAGRRQTEPKERQGAGPALDLALRLLRRQRIQFASIVLRRSVLQETGGFSPIWG